MFPVGQVRKDLPVKTRILGLEINGKARAYPLPALQTLDKSLIDIWGGVSVRIDIDPTGQVVGVFDGKGHPLTHLFAYWFAWQAFHPETTVYRQSK